MRQFKCPHCSHKNNLRLSSDVVCLGCKKIYHVETDREKKIRLALESGDNLGETADG